MTNVNESGRSMVEMTDCTDVATVMDSIAGNKASNCADNSCTLDFSGNTSAIN